MRTMILQLQNYFKNWRVALFSRRSSERHVETVRHTVVASALSSVCPRSDPFFSPSPFHLSHTDRLTHFYFVAKHFCMERITTCSSFRILYCFQSPHIPSLVLFTLSRSEKRKKQGKLSPPPTHRNTSREVKELLRGHVGWDESPGDLTEALSHQLSTYKEEFYGFHIHRNMYQI